jgi:hypothetical protein
MLNKGVIQHISAMIPFPKVEILQHTPLPFSPFFPLFFAFFITSRPENIGVKPLLPVRVLPLKNHPFP